MKKKISYVGITPAYNNELDSIWRKKAKKL